MATRRVWWYRKPKESNSKQYTESKGNPEILNFRFLKETKDPNIEYKILSTEL
jgi:hypothetical protein